MDQDLLKLLSSGGINLIVFVIWYITFKYQSKQFLQSNKQNQEQYQQNIAKLFQLIEEDTKYKELLTGILTRMDIKLDYSIKQKETHQ